MIKRGEFVDQGRQPGPVFIGRRNRLVADAGRGRIVVAQERVQGVYADGVDRRLSRGLGRFMVNNALAPTIGNVCMDMCMIDISNIDAKVGDTVTLFGGPPALTAIDWAQTLGTISYEIYTSIAQRVERVYF